MTRKLLFLFRDGGSETLGEAMENARQWCAKVAQPDLRNAVGNVSLTVPLREVGIDAGGFLMTVQGCLQVADPLFPSPSEDREVRLAHWEARAQVIALRCGLQFVDPDIGYDDTGRNDSGPAT